jgi:amino acid transporter
MEEQIHPETNDEEKPSVLGKLRESTEVDVEWQESHKAQTLDVAIYGVLMLSPSLMYGWNAALVYGFGPWAMALATMSFAYLTVFNCIAEISSCMPFNGGSYGLARVFLGFYAGFMVGAFQWLESIVYSASLVLYTSQLITQYNSWPQKWQIPMWFIHYAFATLVFAAKGSWVFVLNRVFAAGLIFFVGVYFFGALKYVNFNKYAPYIPYDDYLAIENTTATAAPPIATVTHPIVGIGYWFRGGSHAYMYSLPLATWPFGCMETIMFLTAISKNPKISISHGIVCAGWALFGITLVIVFITVSMPPGLYAISNLAYPTNPVFTRVFTTTDDQTASAIPVPFYFLSGVLYLLPASLLTFSLSQSNLLPKIFHMEKHGYNLCIVANSAVGIGICFLGYFAPDIYTQGNNIYFVQTLLTNIGLLGGVFSCLADIVGYIKLKKNFRSFERNFNSPFGYYGAIIAGAGFSTCIIAIAAGYAMDNHIAVVGFLLICAILSLYYFIFAKDKQSLSIDEMKCVFRLHVASNNNRRRKGLFSKKRSTISGIKSIILYNYNSTNDRNNRNGSDEKTESQIKKTLHREDGFSNIAKFFSRKTAQ